MSDDGDGRPIREVTTAKFARIHDVSLWTVRRWISEGKVSAVKSPNGFRWRIILEKYPEQSEAKVSKVK